MNSKKTPSIPYLYNPQNQSKEALIKGFVVRQKTFERIYKEIKAAKMIHPEQHFLIEGKRGMGKTTMLLRLSYEIERDKSLNKWLIPLVFNEEEYGIRKLFKLWERVFELLEENSKSFQGIKTKIRLLSAAHKADEDYEKAAFELLSEELTKRKKKIILFIDNATDMFSKFPEKDAHRFRKVLQTSADLRIIAASATPVRPFYDYRHPFYEFFKIEHLEGLDSKSTFELLSRIGNVQKGEDIPLKLNRHRGRIETLRRLTGGVIRTILLLYELFTDDEQGAAFQDLETILDRVTPLYKHRMDDLPANQQEIVEAIALSWDAISVREITQLTRMESKVISAQLSTLVKNDIIHKIRTHTKNNLYQISERFFNIWYLMRNGRSSDRNRVIWLVRFLEEWCDEVEITERAKQHLHSLEKGNYDPQAALHLSEALAFTKHLPQDIQHELLESTRVYLEKHTKDLSEKLSASDLSLHQKATSLLENKEYTDAIIVLQKMRKSDYLNLAYAYETGLNDYQQAEKYYLKAIKENVQDADYLLASMYHKQANKFRKAEALYKQAIDGGSGKAAFALGTLYLGKKKFDQARESFENAVILDVFDARLMLVFMDISVFKKYYEAEAAFIQLLNEPHIFDSDFEFTPERIRLFGMGFIFLLSRSNRDFLYQFFNSEKAEVQQLKDRFKPIYYTLLYLLKEQYPTEYLRMGSELKETVEEIVELIEKFSSIQT